MKVLTSRIPISRNFLHHLNPRSIRIPLCPLPVIAQYYDVDVNKEYAIRGNSILMKCQIPSYVADFVRIESWHTDQNQSFYLNSTENDEEGWSALGGLVRTFPPFPILLFCPSTFD